MHSEYFEGILQLRDVNGEVYDFVMNLIDKREDVHIAKVKNLKNGNDLYISSARFLQTMGKTLVEKFGGELKVSKRLHTRSRVTGKDVYRVTVLFRQPNFKKGDVIKFKGDKLLVLNTGKKVFCRDVKTNRKMLLSYERLGRQQLVKN